MFHRKLVALGHHHPDNFNITDEDGYRNCIVWLEDQKIRLYKIEDRQALRDTKSARWVSVYNKYLEDLSCPVDKTNKSYALSWLLSHAVRLEYGENGQKFNSQHEERQNRKSDASAQNGTQGQGNLSSITGDDPDLKAGVASLSKLLNIPYHEDHIVVLQALRSLIEQRLSTEGINAARKASTDKKKNKIKEGDYVPVNQVNLGFETKDSAINEAAKIVRLLHIHELRDLQTKINKAIVSVQTLTANPKTDQSLGRVGR